MKSVRAGYRAESVSIDVCSCSHITRNREMMARGNQTAKTIGETQWQIQLILKMRWYGDSGRKGKDVTDCWCAVTTTVFKFPLIKCPNIELFAMSVSAFFLTTHAAVNVIDFKFNVNVFTARPHSLQCMTRCNSHGLSVRLSVRPSRSGVLSIILVSGEV